MATDRKPSQTSIEMEDKHIATIKAGKEDGQANAADDAEHKLSMSKAFKLYYKAVMWSATLSMALVMESYGACPTLTADVNGLY